MRSLILTFRRQRFAILFFSLLLTIAGEPLLSTAGVEGNLWQVFVALNLLAAVLSASTRRARQTLLSLLGVFAAFRLVGILLGFRFLLPASEGVLAFVAVLTLGGTLRAALRRGQVNSERIYAALSVYILAGLIFGVVYWTYEQIWPGSLHVSQGPTELTFWRTIYFSFVTLASLGYGDIVPISNAARGMAILEVISGQMYLAVLVARLVSLYATQERSRSISD